MDTDNEVETQPVVEGEQTTELTVQPDTVEETVEPTFGGFAEEQPAGSKVERDPFDFNIPNLEFDIPEIDTGL